MSSSLRRGTRLGPCLRGWHCVAILLLAFLLRMIGLQNRPLWYDEAFYVFYGPRERKMGGFDPASSEFLEAVYRAGDVVIYRVEAATDP